MTASRCLRICIVCGTFLMPLAAPTAAQVRTVSYNESFEPSIDVEYGGSRPVLDTAGWLLGVPRKLLMFNSRVDNHRVSEETVDSVATFLARKELGNVKVRVNQWDPIGEWQRLVDNRQMGAGWKYTVGTLHHLQYTFLPGRLFGGDKYNPFTNTVSIYSDVPALGFVESSYAGDVRDRKSPGAYATIQSLPLMSMWHESIATEDTLRYIAVYGSPEEMVAARRVLYARYGIEMGGELGSVVHAGDALQLVGAAAGHIAAFGRNRKTLHPQLRR